MLMIKPVSVVSDLSNIENARTFDIYPNPVKSTLYISVNKESSFALVDIPERQILKMELKSGLNVIDVKDLKPGIYLMKGENTDLNYRLVKE